MASLICSVSGKYCAVLRNRFFLFLSFFLHNKTFHDEHYSELLFLCIFLKSFQLHSFWRFRLNIHWMIDARRDEVLCVHLYVSA